MPIFFVQISNSSRPKSLPPKANGVISPKYKTAMTTGLTMFPIAVPIHIQERLTGVNRPGLKIVRTPMIMADTNASSAAIVMESVCVYIEIINKTITIRRQDVGLAVAT